MLIEAANGEGAPGTTYIQKRFANWLKAGVQQHGEEGNEEKLVDVRLRTSYARLNEDPARSLAIR